jgi:hypothetical protein
MWDGRFRTLEQQALGPFRRGEMGITVEEAVYRLNDDPEYAHLFAVAFNSDPSTSGMASALAAYQRTLVSEESRFEPFLRTSDPRVLSSLEHDGYLIFDGRAGCSNCHSVSERRFDARNDAPVLLTDWKFHNLGIGYRTGRFADPGRFAVARLERDLGAFRTPSLRTVARTARLRPMGIAPIPIPAQRRILHRLLLRRLRRGRSCNASSLAVLACLFVPLHLGLLTVGLVHGRRYRGLLGNGGRHDGECNRGRCDGY